MAKISQSAKVREYIKQNPTKKVAEVAKDLGLKYQFVYVTKRNMDVKYIPKQYLTKKSVAKMQAEFKPAPHMLVDLTQHKDGSITEKITMVEPTPDLVNHPAHYKYGGIETIDFIEAKELGYNLGNVVKYITRSDHKGNRKEDLLKAQWYLTREINSIK
jgi:hypothetical protein